MATATERLQWLISANADQAVREFQRVGSAAQSNLKGAEDRIDKLAGRMTAFGAGALAFAGVAGVGLHRLAEEASSLAEATASMQVVFGEAAAAVEDFASSSARSFGQSKRAALDASITFGTFGKQAGLTGDELAQFSINLTKLASDLASFRDTSPEQAVTALGAALRGESEPLRYYGVLLNDARLKQEALELGIYSGNGALTTQQKILAANRAIFEDTADAQGAFARESDSLANQQRILNAQLADLRANIGTGVLPMFQSLVGGANQVLGAFNELDPSVQTAIGRIAGIGTATIGAIGGLSLIAGQVLKMRDRFTDASLSVNVLGRQLNLFGAAARGAAVLGAVVALDAAFAALADHAGKATSALEDVVAAGGNGAAAVEAFYEAVRQTESAEGVFEGIGETIAEMFGRGRQDLDSWRDAFDDLVRQSIPAARVVLEQLREQWRDATNADELLPLLDEFEGMIDRQIRLHVELQRQSQATADEIAKLADESDDAADTLGDLADKHEDAGRALREHQEGLRRFNEAMTEHRSRVLEQIDSELAWERAQERARDAVVDLQEALKEHGATSDEARRATREAAEEILAMAAAYAEAQGESADTKRGQELMIEALRGVREFVGSPLAETIDGYIARLESIPEEVSTKVSADTREAEAALARIEGFLNRIFGAFGGGRAIRIPAPPVANAEPRATGGPVDPDKLYLVGEEGPELVQFNQRGFVYDSRTTSEILGFTMDSARAASDRLRELADQVEDAKRRVERASEDTKREAEQLLRHYESLYRQHLDAINDALDDGELLVEDFIALYQREIAALEGQAERQEELQERLTEVIEEHADRRYQIGELSAEDFIEFLRRQQEGLVRFSDRWWQLHQRITAVEREAAREREEIRREEERRREEAERAAEDAARKREQAQRDELDRLRNKFQLTGADRDAYIRALLSAASRLEPFSNEWTSIVRELQSLGFDTGSLLGRPAPQGVPLGPTGTTGTGLVVNHWNISGPTGADIAQRVIEHQERQARLVGVGR